MSKRICDHVRRNVYPFVALFFAISGTAVALNGQNTGLLRRHHQQ